MNQPPRDDAAFKAALMNAKADGNLIFQTLGIKGACSHGKCPFCQKPNLFVKNRKGLWTWSCYGCNERGGTVIDAISILEKKTTAEVCREIFKKTQSGGYKPKPYQNGKTPQEPEVQDAVYEEPKIDLERAEKFCSMAHTALLNNDYAQEHYMTKKRGISLEVVEKYRLGFIEGFPIDMLGKDGRPDYKWMIPAAWVFPVTGIDGKTIRGVKLHFEERPLKGDGVTPIDGKSMWMPFGTEPKHDRVNNIMPRHAYITYWPHPATLRIEKEGQNFTDDPTYWVRKIPEGSKAKEAWDMALEESKLLLGLEISKSPSDFEANELDTCFRNAFSLCSREIQEAVLQDNPSSLMADDLSSYTCIMPGELKSFATLSAGLMATAFTGGESSPPSLEMLSYFRRRRIAIFPDDDKPQLRQNIWRRPGFRSAQVLEGLFYKLREKGIPIPEIKVVKLPRR